MSAGVTGCRCDKVGITTGVSRKLTIAATPQVGSVGPGAEQDEIEKIEHVVQ
jgi:hypothetical protein